MENEFKSANLIRQRTEITVGAFVDDHSLLFPLPEENDPQTNDIKISQKQRRKTTKKGFLNFNNNQNYSNSIFVITKKRI